MDYEKAYKDALSRARSMYDSKDDAELAAFIFPELKESEDERIRKGIVNFILYKAGHLLDEETEHKFIAYLEKQKAPNARQRLAEWSKTEEGKAKYEEVAKEMREEMEKEQKPAEWSEEDKKMLLSIIYAFRNGTVSTIGQEQWLKSLPERFNLQPIQEWSEEDEKRIKQLIYDTEAIRAGYEKKKEQLGDRFNDALIKDCDEQIRWLKSLRPSWKPSEEQMEHLQRAINCYESDWGENK